ncbi:oxygenase MpaB family protein [Mycolicibacterium baixiangningiae]|uniref:oxygenase MpaB family protein n=1 Tax=Mycolicibacterium baixiangningiae TaxID=2761578 RepID=UPI001D00E4DF|nr:oxygenase MpaB family protein [Mycolicibacterium baixiangningiae]
MVTIANREQLTVSDRVMDTMFEPIRRQFFKNVQFAEPAGDPGWFGPGSAVWYVHSHLPTFQIGLSAAAMMETLHPTMAWMGYEHTRAIERRNGVPTGNFDDKGMSSRTGHSVAFFLGVTMGPTAVAEQVCRTVVAMHDKIEGVRPDGHAYRASDPELLTWNYATQAWGLAAAHTAWHPRPLRGERLEQFFREYATMGEALGAVDPPRTQAGVMQLLEDWAPYMGVTIPTVRYLNPLAPWRYPVYQRPLYALVSWAVQDLHPQWAKQLMNTPQYTPAGRAARRRAMKALLNSMGTGQIREVRQAWARTAGKPAAVAV